MDDAATLAAPDWRKRTMWLLFAIMLIVVGFVACLVYLGITTSLRAETTLQANRFVFRLVEQFVSERHRWPLSWAELEQEKMTWEGGRFGADWPAESPRVQQCVAIDFAADPARIVLQDPMDFRAIQPIGPCYGREEQCVPSLQKVIRRSIRTLNTDK
jgi:hypothetical protein